MADQKKVKLRMAIQDVDPQQGKVTRYECRQELGDPCADGKGNIDFKDAKKWDAGVEIDFRVDNNTPHEMAFCEDNPILILEGAVCPENGVNSAPEEFEVCPSKNDKLQLTVIDRNKTRKDFGYALRLQSRASQTGHFLLDPIITNGGGGDQS